jgi:YidC/Oxa1 family membrane protein insertase
MGIYNFVGNYGITLILFSLAVKLILLPISAKSKRGMMKQARLAPKIKQLEKQYGKDRQRYAKEVQALYDRHEVSATGGCLWALIPLPILLLLYSVIRQPLTYLMKLSAEQIATLTTVLTGSSEAVQQMELSSIISQQFNAARAAVPEVVALNYKFLGLDLSLFPQWNPSQWADFSWGTIGLFLLPFLSGLFAFLAMKVSTRSNNLKREPGEEESPADKTTRQMNLIMPLISVWIGFIMPASMTIYWMANSLFGMAQDYVLGKTLGERLDKEDAEREARLAEEEAERKRQRAEAIARREEEMKNRRKKGGNATDGEKQEKKRESTHEKGQIDDRPYARGRSYDPERYGMPPAGEPEEAPEDFPGEPAALEENNAETRDTDPGDGGE